MEHYLSIYNLPVEIIYRILHFVDGHSILTKISRLSKIFNSICNDDLKLWKEICLKEKLPINHLPPNCPYPWRWLWMSKNIKYQDGITGPARQVLPDGYVYEGDFVNGKRNGYGIKTKGSELYIGTWTDDFMDGIGHSVDRKGTYDGMFKYGYRNGCGKHILTDGSTYVGEYRNNHRHGKGRYVWPDGSVYDGEWKSDKMNGYGINTWASGPFKDDVYKGYMKDNMRHGQGTYRWADGRIYCGEWENNDRHGFGRYIFPDGSTYEGEWYCGLRHGQGKQTLPSGDFYEGLWEFDHPINFNIDDEWNGFFNLSIEDRKSFVRSKIQRLM